MPRGNGAESRIARPWGRQTCPATPWFPVIGRACVLREGGLVPDDDKQQRHEAFSWQAGTSHP